MSKILRTPLRLGFFVLFLLCLAPLSLAVAQSANPSETQVAIHYRRLNGDYDGWGLHVWGPTTEQGITWQTPLMPDGEDEYGIYWLIEMEVGAPLVNYIVHLGDQKDPGPDQSLDITSLGREIWLIQGSATQYTDPDSAMEALLALSFGDITKQNAYWVTPDTILWPLGTGAKAKYTLLYSPTGEIKASAEGLVGGEEIVLEFVARKPAPELLAKYPRLRQSVQLRLPASAVERVPELLRGQTAIKIQLPDGTHLDATGLQIAGVLDTLYPYDGVLGVSWQGTAPALQVWAPTASSVTLHLFDTPTAEEPSLSQPMEFNPANGVWQVVGSASWKGKFYLYEVAVFVPREGKFYTNVVTDPYSFSLTQNSTKSQIVDLSEPDLQPAGWQALEKPPVENFNNLVIYELHMRDFSALDESVPADERGTYLAFTHPDSIGMTHLAQLAQAGLTHLHLLPTFDIATINEDKSTWQYPDYAALAELDPTSEEQQAEIQALRGTDPFNWGYDPYHYTVPEGSYSTNPQGTDRIVEFRQMVQALNGIGLNVVLDVVYNHTNAAYQSEKSVLDKIVPGYYHRLNDNGSVATSTCCQNTATENAMMRKLMIDSVLTWAVQYKVDGFRFDLMGHHMKDDMLAVRAALDSLTLEKDGVDGKRIYVYGEGWDFGEVADNVRGVNATQLNLAGTGIGTFNDRLRDAVRGGNPFRDVREQGFATGLFLAPNVDNALSADEQKAALLALMDNIRIGLAGNLAGYTFVGASGEIVRGDQLDYNGEPAGYNLLPQENVVYVSAHDNEALFDAIQYKAAEDVTIAERVKMQQLALTVPMLSQGVPFFDAGSDLLRSKSFERDSYDSGDYFNRIDWTGQSNNWGIGLPPKDRNGNNYPLITRLLSNPDLAASPEQIQATSALFQDFLQIRKSSPLFHLQTAEEVQNVVKFYNLGPDQTPGLIVMVLQEGAESIVVLFNATRESQTFQISEGLSYDSYALHPILATNSSERYLEMSADGTKFTVPALSTGVFVGGIVPAEAPTAETIYLPVIGGESAPAATPTPAEAPRADSRLPLLLVFGGAIVLGALAGLWTWRRKQMN
jgi:pullulanase-type alpha-1,6-glucosidase